MTHIDHQKQKELSDFLEHSCLSDAEQKLFIDAISQHGLTPELHDKLDKALFMHGAAGLDPDGVTDILLQIAHLTKNRNEEVESLFQNFESQFLSIEKEFDELITQHDSECDVATDESSNERQKDEQLDAIDQKYAPKYASLAQKRKKLHQQYRNEIQKIDSKYQKKYEALAE